MPRLIDAGDGSAIGVDALVEALDASDFDVCCEESFASLGPLLARLGRNRHFLADLALEELKERCRHQGATNGYGAQVFLLRPANGRYVLRANFWPSLADAAVRASGAAAFLYGMPHDHNFSFLTYGYLGPGYWSDYYEYDVDTVAGVPGEFADLRFVERSRLDLGKLMLYRARRDVHAQLPPDRFSVSLNILGYDPAQPWMDQFRFNLATGAIAGGLTTTPSQALLAIATGFGCGNALDLATNFAAHHPSPRMRITALDAVAGQSAHAEERHAVFAAAINDADAYVSGHARLRCAAIEQAVNTP
ncbi:MAG: transposase [Sphingomonas sp.]|jgi:hypothetical protein